MPTISVVIRTYNEERLLPRLLEALDRQASRDLELIVVDSGSLDRTVSIARAAGVRLIEIAKRDFTFGYSLNRGIAAATGRWVVLISAHACPTNDRWIEKLVEPLESDRVAMVYGRQWGVAESKFSEFRDFARTFGSRRLTLQPPNFFANNANSAFPRRLWEDVPFDESLPGLEDIAWAKHWMDRGLDVVYEPEAGIYHVHDETWSGVEHRYFREAVAARRIGIRSVSHIPTEIITEGWRTFSDAVAVFREARGIATLQEVLRFRFAKTRGTILGLTSDVDPQDPDEHDAYYYPDSSRAVVILGPGHAELRSRRVPDVKPGDVLIRVDHVGVCRTDVEIYEGALGYYKRGEASYPIIPGHEFCGTVLALGQNATGVARGDRVVVECIQSCGTCVQCAQVNFIGCATRRELGVMGLDGAYADHLVVPAEFVHRLSPDTNPKKAVLCEPLAVVHKGLRRLAGAMSAEPASVAVVGAGPIGQLTAAILSHRGWEVTLFDRRQERSARAAAADPRIRIGKDAQDIATFDVVVEATGDPEALDAALLNSRPGATILLLGLPYARREFSFEMIVAYDKTVVGSVGSDAQDFEAAVALLDSLSLDHLLDYELPLEEFKRAWSEAVAGLHAKIILTTHPTSPMGQSSVTSAALEDGAL